MDTTANQSGAARGKRVSQACNNCRPRKQRCDGRRPTCAACFKARRLCSYDHAMAKRRGLPTGYVRSLELLWALMFAVVPNSIDILKRILQEIQFTMDSRGQLAIATNLIRYPGLLRETWERSGLRTKLDSLLSKSATKAIDSGNPAGLHNTQKSASDGQKPFTTPFEDSQRQSSLHSSPKIPARLHPCSPSTRSMHTVPNGVNLSTMPARCFAVDKCRTPQSRACSTSHVFDSSTNRPGNCWSLLPHTDFTMKDQFTPTEDTVSVTDGLARPGPNAEKPYYDPTWNGDGDLTESEGDTLAHGLLDAHVVEAEILGSDDGCSLGTKSVHTYYEATFAELLNFMYMGGARISDFTFW